VLLAFAPSGPCRLKRNLAALFWRHCLQPPLAAYPAPFTAHVGHNLRNEGTAGFFDQRPPNGLFHHPKSVLGIVQLAIAPWHTSIMPRIASRSEYPRIQNASLPGLLPGARIGYQCSVCEEPLQLTPGGLGIPRD
jgi:hypothetical protein